VGFGEGCQKINLKEGMKVAFFWVVASGSLVKVLPAF
jgi:hypothetical protein